MDTSHANALYDFQIDDSSDDDLTEFSNYRSKKQMYNQTLSSKNQEKIVEENSPLHCREPSVVRQATFQCSNCNFSSFSAQDFVSRRHSCNSFTFNIFQCSCSEVLTTSSELENHAKEHRRNDFHLLFSPIKDHSLLCSKDCIEKMCFSTSSKKLEDISSMIKSKSKSQLHQFLLETLNHQSDMGLCTNSFVVLGKIKFCHNSIQSIFGISKYLLNTVLKEFEGGQRKYCHGNHGNDYMKPKRDSAIAFIHHFALVHCENLPDKSVLQMPSYMTIQTIYENYKEATLLHMQEGEREFYKIFHSYFGGPQRLNDFLPRVVFLPKSTHPICNECATISDLRKKASSTEEENYAVSRKRFHLVEIRRKYLNFTYRRDLPLRLPDEYLHIGLDDMDQEKIKSPKLLRNTKESSGMLKLNNHLTGVIVTNSKFVNDKLHYVYMNNDQFCQGSNKTISILFDVLKDVQNLIGKIPRKLLIQTDNCHKDLKNQLVLSFYYYLVEIDILDEVLISHMPVGHTHNDVDAFFSVIANKLKKVELPTFESMMKEIGDITLSGVKTVIKELQFCTDFVTAIEPFFQSIQGHTCFFQFKIRKENNKTALYVKQDELDDGWAFPTGVQLLRSPLPLSLNLSVGEFRQEHEYSEIFKSVWNKYIPTLSDRYDCEKVVEIKQMWEDRIKLLIDIKKDDYEPFDLKNLIRSPPCCPSFIQTNPVQNSRRRATLRATFYEEDPISLTVQNLKTDSTLVVYCEVKRSRPWVCLLSEVVSSTEVKVQWMKKERNGKYMPDNLPDGTPYTSVIDKDSIMFTDCMVNECVFDGRNGPYKFEKHMKRMIDGAYHERDKNLSLI